VEKFSVDSLKKQTPIPTNLANLFGLHTGHKNNVFEIHLNQFRYKQKSSRSATRF
jgi:hypothetical protein